VRLKPLYRKRQGGQKLDYRVLLKARIEVVIMTAVKTARKARSPEMLVTGAFLKRMDFRASTA